MTKIGLPGGDEIMAAYNSDAYRNEIEADWGDGEVRSVDSDTGAEKGTKLARYDLIPTGPLKQLAEHYGKGAEKYAAHNWRLGYDWSKSYAALQRHANQFWDGEDLDDELRSNHMVAVAFHAFALLEYCDTMRNKDDRWSTIKSKEQ